MDIIIQNDSAVPLYEQMMQQIKAGILKGELEQGEALPSIRMMAKELKVSIITVRKRRLRTNITRERHLCIIS